MSRPGLATPPASLCLVRLSALGDVINAVPIVRTLQRHWPDTALTWLIGNGENALVGDLPGVRFETYDKKAGWRGLRDLHRRLDGRRFDVRLQMQLALRANLAGACASAPIRVGYDRDRSKEGHGLFVNRRIAAPTGRHVVDTYFAFLEALGLREQVLDWSVPIPEAEHESADALLADCERVVLLSPSSSHARRNWRPERYAAVADTIAGHGYDVVLVGGPAPAERDLGDAILDAMRRPALDLIGRSPLKRLLALLERAELMITPDSGPAHFASATGTDVIALHAATEAARSGPYRSLQWCVDRYDEAARRYRGKPAEALPWGHKIHEPDVMDLIAVDDVLERFESWREAHQSGADQ